MRPIFVLGVVGAILTASWAVPRPPTKKKGDAVIRAKAGKSEIVITTTARLAGAIHSLTWDGKELIDSHDHGRQLQSASNLDCSREFIPEVFNPTEAGSRADGRGPTSSSKLVRMRTTGAALETLTQMAFWLRPGEKSEGHLAYNKTVLSKHLVRKRVRIGYKTFAQVIDYEVVFWLPPAEKHTFAQFEALTGYMPPELSKFWKLDARAGKLVPLDDGPGEQAWPVVLATPDGRHAMGVYSPDQPSRGFAHVGYGRFRFKAEKVVKWNCVFRVRQAKGIEESVFRYRMFVFVGTLADVERDMKAVIKERGRK